MTKKIENNEDLGMVVEKLVKYLTEELEVTDDVEILTVITGALSGCLAMLANSVAKERGVTEEQCRKELVEVACKELIEQVMALKIMPKNDNQEGGTKPLLLN